ncbi:MAG: class I SAM-dependent DNA methyltransferase [Candidatus Thiodiazotropha sp.]
MTSEEFKATLWSSANILRGSVAAAEYKYPVLALVFLKYVSDIFDAQADVIRSKLADPNSPLFMEDPELREEMATELVEDRDAFAQDNVIWVPEGARYKDLLVHMAADDLAQRLDKAMKAIEDENAELVGVLYRDFGRLELEPGKLGELMKELAKLKFDPKDRGSRDIFGEVYEYFLGEFAKAEGQKAGEFYTPKSVVNLLVEILAPFKGKIYDPACGSGGMFVQSLRFMRAHETQLGETGDLPIYGQELMATTRKLCKMNLAVHGLRGDLGNTYGSTFTNDQHPNLRADYILANPPFNISKWGGEQLADDPRWQWGVPPKNNANYAWLQHMASRLSQRGRAGIVLANGSMTTQTSGEGEIRKNLTTGDLVECMVALPGQLFTNTQIPACLWFLSKDKGAGANGAIDRKGQVLFIDCRKKGAERLSRTQVAFTDEELHEIASTYHRWRGTDFSDGEGYADVPGFCYSSSLADTDKHHYALMPGRYVGAADMGSDDEIFEDKMAELAARVSERMTRGRELEEEIRQQLAEVGYEL